MGLFLIAGCKADLVGIIAPLTDSAVQPGEASEDAGARNRTTVKGLVLRNMEPKHPSLVGNFVIWVALLVPKLLKDVRVAVVRSMRHLPSCCVGLLGQSTWQRLRFRRGEPGWILCHVNLV